MGKRYWDFKTYESGLETVFKPYQILAMEYLWSLEEGGAGSGKVWKNVNKTLNEKGQTISRASIIFFLNDMVDHKILSYVEKTGKGGYHRIYTPEFNETGFKEYLAKQIISRLIKEFPDETRNALNAI